MHIQPFGGGLPRSKSTSHSSIGKFTKGVKFPKTSPIVFSPISLFTTAQRVTHVTNPNNQKGFSLEPLSLSDDQDSEKKMFTNLGARTQQLLRGLATLANTAPQTNKSDNPLPPLSSLNTKNPEKAPQPETLENDFESPNSPDISISPLRPTLDTPRHETISDVEQLTFSNTLQSLFKVPVNMQDVKETQTMIRNALTQISQLKDFDFNPEELKNLFPTKESYNSLINMIKNAPKIPDKMIENLKSGTNSNELDTIIVGLILFILEEILFGSDDATNKELLENLTKTLEPIAAVYDTKISELEGLKETLDTRKLQITEEMTRDLEPSNPEDAHKISLISNYIEQEAKKHLTSLEASLASVRQQRDALSLPPANEWKHENQIRRIGCTLALTLMKLSPIAAVITAGVLHAATSLSITKADAEGRYNELLSGVKEKRQLSTDNIVKKGRLTKNNAINLGEFIAHEVASSGIKDVADGALGAKINTVIKHRLGQGVAKGLPGVILKGLLGNVHNPYLSSEDLKELFQDESFTKKRDDLLHQISKDPSLAPAEEFALKPSKKMKVRKQSISEVKQEASSATQKADSNPTSKSPAQSSGQLLSNIQQVTLNALHNQNRTAEEIISRLKTSSAKWLHHLNSSDMIAEAIQDNFTANDELSTGLLTALALKLTSGIVTSNITGKNPLSPQFEEEVFQALSSKIHEIDIIKDSLLSEGELMENKLDDIGARFLSETVNNFTQKSCTELDKIKSNLLNKEKTYRDTGTTTDLLNIILNMNPLVGSLTSSGLSVLSDPKLSPSEAKDTLSSFLALIKAQKNWASPGESNVTLAKGLHVSQTQQFLLHGVIENIHERLTGPGFKLKVDGPTMASLNKKSMAKLGEALDTFLEKINSETKISTEDLEHIYMYTTTMIDKINMSYGKIPKVFQQSIADLSVSLAKLKKS